MIRHMVMWNLKEIACDGTKEENALIIKQKLENLVGRIEGLNSLHIGRNILENGFDLSLYSEFESLEALNFYKSHPLHKECQKFVHAVITERVACDSVID